MTRLPTQHCRAEQNRWNSFYSIHTWTRRYMQIQEALDRSSIVLSIRLLNGMKKILKSSNSPVFNRISYQWIKTQKDKKVLKAKILDFGKRSSWKIFYLKLRYWTLENKRSSLWNTKKLWSPCIVNHVLVNTRCRCLLS